MSLGSLLDDIPTLDDVRFDGGFFAGIDRGEWIRNLEHHFRYGEALLMVWSEPGVGKSTLITQLASRLDPGVYTVVTLDARRGGTVEHFWSALDRRLSLPQGAEGWEALKRVAKQLASAGQSLAIIIDHADKLTKEAVQLLRAMLDVNLPECRFVLALDGAGTQPQGQWPAIEAQLFDQGQLARLWPFKDEDAQAYLDFRLQHASLGDVVLTDKQKLGIVSRSRGNAAAIRAELQRLLAEGALVGGPPKSPKKGAPVKKTDAPATPAATLKGENKASKPVAVPKAQTVALSVLAIALLGFYLVWEQPVPSSVIATPSPTAQNVPRVVKPLDAPTPPGEQTAEETMAAVPPVAGGLPSPVKTPLSDVATAAESVNTTDPLQVLASQPRTPPPAGFVPSNVPLMAAKGATPGQPPVQPFFREPEAKTGTPGARPAVSAAARPTASAARATPPPRTPPARAAAPANRATKPVATVASSAPASRVGASPADGGAPYTLQIMGLRDLRSVQAVMRENAGVSGLRYQASTLNGQPWYVIVQGEYPTRQAAQAAAKRLPPALRAGKPFAKSLSAL